MESTTNLREKSRRSRIKVRSISAIILALIGLTLYAGWSLVGALGGPEQPDVATESNRGEVEPSAVVAARVQVSTPTPTPTAEVPTPAPTEPVVVADVRVDPTNVLALTPDARYGYVAARNAWLDPVACTAPTEEVLVGVDLGSSTADDIKLFEGGLQAAGSIQQLAVSAQGQAAVMMSCGDATETPWLQIIDFDDNGRVGTAGARISLPEQDWASGPYLVGWEDEATVRLYVYPNGEWHELRVDVATGDVSSPLPRSYDDEFVVPARSWATTPDGRFAYREIDDPSGRPGCEGTGFVVTIELDDGSGPRPAITDPDVVFATVADLHFGLDNLVSWRSSCEGFATPFVGRIQPDGMISEVREIDVYSDDERQGSATEYRHFRLSNDGSLVGLGARYSAESDPQIAVFKVDLASDGQPGAEAAAD